MEEQNYFEKGKTYYFQNQFSLAVEAFKEAVKVNPRNIHAFILLAKSYRALGEDNLAKLESKKAADIATNDDSVHTELFDLFKENKMYETAIKEYEKIPRNNLDKMMVLDLLALYNFKGQFDKIREIAGPLLSDPSWQQPYLKNRLMNELEISQKKTILQSKPRILLVTLTNRCNLNCYMCGRGESDWQISPKIVEQITGSLPFLDLITWQGGEVFLADSFGNLFEKTFGLEYLKQIIITNALLITERWAERLASRNNVGLTISIDCVDKKNYEYIRRGASFEKLIQNLKIINKERRKHSYNMITTLRCTVMKANYDQLDKFIEFARDYEFDIVQMAPLSSDGYDPQNIFANKDTEILRHITREIPRIRELSKKYKIKLLDWIPTLHGYNSYTETVVLKEDESIKKPVCFRPWKQLAMNVKGDIFPECLCSEPIGDVFHNTLDEVWNNEKMQEYRKKLSGHKFIDWCNNDCISGTIPPEHLKFTFA